MTPLLFTFQWITDLQTSGNGSLVSNLGRWVSELDFEAPIYALPIDAFSSIPLQTAFGHERFAAERAFTQACAEAGVIGVWQDQTVQYHLLTRSQITHDDSIRTEGGQDRRQRAIASVTAGRMTSSMERLLGVVGWLLTEPQYLNEINALRQAYQDLPISDRPSFLLLHLAMRRPDDTDGISPAAEPVVAQLRGFLRRWGLNSLPTWDLPDPQGPLLPNPFPTGHGAQPRHGVHLFIPTGYSLQGDDEILRMVRNFQRQAAINAGLPTGLGGAAITPSMPRCSA